MKTRFGNLIIIILIIILLLTIGDIILTYQNLVIVHDNASLVDKTYQINSELDTTLIAVVNAETGQRGYLLTGDTNYLHPYSDALPTISLHNTHLLDLTKDSPVIEKKIPLLQKTIQERIALLKQGVRLHSQESFDTEQAQGIETSGKQKMDDIRMLIDNLQNDERNLLTVRELQTEKSYLTLFGSSAFTSLLSIIFIILTYYSFNREIAKRTELEKNKDEFFNMASHELKTPITSLNIFIHVLRKKINAGQKLEARKYLAKITAQTDKLIALITDFLDLARVQTGKMKYHEEKFTIEPLIQETIDEIKGTTKKHTIITKGNSKVMLSGDRDRIYQVLVNLITNAIKYSPKGGKIFITIRKENTMVIVSVQDQGIGIDKKYQDKIFDRLYQVNDPALKAYPGFGIGLFVSKEIIRHHKGKIWVESEKGKGSTFSFSLPLTTKRY